MSENSEKQTLESLVEDRQGRDLPVHVHVVGNFDFVAPKGRNVAEDVAELLVAEDGRILTEDFGRLDDGDVAFVTVEKPPSEDDQLRQDLHNLTAVSRTKRLAGIVVFAEELPHQMERYLDARVWAVSGDVDLAESLHVDMFGGDVYAVELDGVRTDAE